MSANKNYINIYSSYLPYYVINNKEWNSLYHTGFKGWLKSNSEEKSLVSALENLEDTLRKVRGEEAFEELKGHVLTVCFLAQNYETLQPLPPKKMQESYKNTIENIKSTCDEINELKVTIETKVQIPPNIPKNPNNKIATGFYSIPILGAVPEDLEKYLQGNNPGKPLQEIPIESFQKVLDVLWSGLQSHLEMFQRQQKNEYPTLIYNQVGPLIYPKKVSSAQNVETPEVNGLIFNLILLFRQYTNLPNDENWLKTKTGLLPNQGKPHHNIVANFVNTIFPTAKKKGDDLSLGMEPKTISQRISDLRKSKVKLGSWL